MMDRYILQVLEANSSAVEAVNETRKNQEASLEPILAKKAEMDQAYLDKFAKEKLALDENLDTYLQSVQGLYDGQLKQKVAAMDRIFEDNFEGWLAALFDEVVK
jgi:hypothetical protein